MLIFIFTHVICLTARAIYSFRVCDCRVCRSAEKPSINQSRLLTSYLFFSFNISVRKRCPQTSCKSLIAHPHNCNINVCLTIKVIDGVDGDLSAVKSAAPFESLCRKQVRNVFPHLGKPIKAFYFDGTAGQQSAPVATRSSFADTFIHVKSP